jgi:hypothetical protein
MYETEENKQNTNSYTSEYGTYQMPDIKVSQMETEGKKTSYSVAGFVLSIIAFFTSFTIFLGLINGILGLVFSLYGIKRGGKGFAIAGIVISVVSLVISCLILSGVIQLINGAVTNFPGFEDFRDIFDYYGQNI